MSLSPTCTINGSATPGSVSPGTVNGALVNTSGVNVFIVKATSADDVTGQSGVATVNASLSIDATHKTFSYTHPNTTGGSAIIFTVTVGISANTTLGTGIDANGEVHPEWTATFKVNVVPASGVVLMALSEVGEQGPSGWLPTVNGAAKGANSSSGSGNLGQFNTTITAGANGVIGTTGLSLLTLGFSGSPGAANCTGFSTTASSKAGLPLVVFPPAGQQFTIKHLDATAGTNGVNCGRANGADFVSEIDGSPITLNYDTTANIWRIANTTREPGPQKVYDIRKAGAKGNGQNLTACTADRVAAQAAITAALAASANGAARGTVYVPSFQTSSDSTYLFDRPLFVNDNNLNFEGEAEPAGSNIYTALSTNDVNTGHNNYVTCPTVAVLRPFDGPTYFQEGAFTYAEFDPALTNQFSGWMGILLSHWFDNLVGSNINGASAISFEFWVDPRSLNPTVNQRHNIINSSGSFGNSVTTQAFNVYLSGTGSGAHLTFFLTTTSGTFTLTSPSALTASTPAYCKCVLGSGTMTMLINGSVVATLSAAGTIVQNWWEQVIFGPAEFSTYPSTVTSNLAAKYRVGELLVLSTADTSTTVPSSPLGTIPTAGLLQMSFVPANVPANDWVVATASGGNNTFRPLGFGGGPVWLHWMCKASNVGYLNNFRARHLTFLTQGVGLYTWDAVHGHVEDCEFTCQNCCTLDGFSYGTTFERNIVTANNQSSFNVASFWGLGFGHGTQYNEVGNGCLFTGRCSWGIASGDISSTKVTGAHAVTSDAQGGMYGNGDLFDLDACYVLDDTAIFHTAAVVFNQLLRARMSGGYAAISNNTVPAIMLANVGACEIFAQIGAAGASAAIELVPNSTGQTSPVRVYTNALLNNTKLCDGTVPVQVVQNEQFGEFIYNFTSDADITLAYPTGSTVVIDFSYRKQTFTDTGGVLTTLRQVIPPTFLLGFTRVVSNFTLQALLYGGVYIPAGATYMLESDGSTTWRRVIISTTTDPWVPTNIAGCKLWLRADTGVTLNSGNVSAWTDGSGAGNNFSQGTAANQPPLNTAGINGLPSVDTRSVVSGNPDLVCANAGSSIITGATAECFIVFQAKEPQSIGGTFKGDWGKNWGTSGSDTFFPNVLESGGTFDDFASTVRQALGTSIDLHTKPVIYNVSSAASSWIARINNVQVFSNGTNTVAASGSAPHIVGNVASTSFWQGLFSEMIVYSGASALTTLQRSLVYAYLRERYHI